MTKIEVCRGKRVFEVTPDKLTTNELVDILDSIEISYQDSWMPETTKKEGYAALREAIRRLKEGSKK